MSSDGPVSVREQPEYNYGRRPGYVQADVILDQDPYFPLPDQPCDIVFSRPDRLAALLGTPITPFVRAVSTERPSSRP